MTGAGDGSHAMLVLGFESADHDVEPWMRRALELCTDHGGRWERRGPGGDGDAVGSWREAFLRAPLPARHVRRDRRPVARPSRRRSRGTGSPRSTRRCSSASARRVERGVRRRAPSRAASRTCTPTGRRRITRSSRRPAAARRSSSGREIKAAASEAVIAAGGTITHHHAVGRDHRPWYDRQRPEPFAAALRGAKAALDPAGALNPGVLIDP